MTEFLDVPGGRIAYEGEAIVAAMAAGAGTVAMVDGAGHYPHAQSPDAAAELVIPFLKEHTGA